jgi:hypothetical protein
MNTRPQIKTPRALLCVIALLSALTAGDCVAASSLSTSISSPTPTGSWLSAGLGGNGEQWFNNSATAYQYWAQQFKAPSEAVLDTISVRLSAGSAASASEAGLTFSIKSYSTLGTWTGATTIATLTTALPSSPTPTSWQNQWLTFSFSGDPIILQQGLVYSIEFNLNRVSGGPTLFTYFGTNVPGVTSGAYHYGSSDSGGNYSLTSKALGMIISATPVPEPSSAAALFGAGALVFSIFTCRRRSRSASAPSNE